MLWLIGKPVVLELHRASAARPAGDPTLVQWSTDGQSWADGPLPENAVEAAPSRPVKSTDLNAP